MVNSKRTQTLTKDYSDFLSTGIILTKSKSVSPAVTFLLEKRPEVILDGICSPLQWQCTKTMQKMCSLIPVIVEQYSKGKRFLRLYAGALGVKKHETIK